jgi:hypothetical protein
MVGIVEERDHDRIVGIVAMICWISPVEPVFGKQMMNSRIQNGVIWHGK